MTISKDLFLSILSMDVYNRGYEAGIADSGVGDPDGLGDRIGIQVGAATIEASSDSDPESPEASSGFYAISYSVDGSNIEGWDTDKTKVLAFRGTNTSLDYLRGWFVGAGDILTGTQAQLALDELLLNVWTSFCVT